jgi:hypothetical protein
MSNLLQYTPLVIEPEKTVKVPREHQKSADLVTKNILTPKYATNFLLSRSTGGESLGRIR